MPDERREIRLKRPASHTALDGLTVIARGGGERKGEFGETRDSSDAGFPGQKKEPWFSARESRIRLLPQEDLSMTRTTAIAVSICCLVPFLNLSAQSDDIAGKIKQLQQESRDAQMKNDASWAQAHLADGFVAGNSWGAWETKDEFLKDLSDKSVKWKSGTLSDINVASFGPDVAVSHYTFTYDAQFKDIHRARTVLCSDTWINDSGTWKIASTHCTLVKGK
jgi:hypothetical protein